MGYNRKYIHKYPGGKNAPPINTSAGGKLPPLYCYGAKNEDLKRGTVT